MEVDEWLPLCGDNYVVRCVVRTMARKPGATLVLLTLGCVLLLPLLVHGIFMLALTILLHVGLLRFEGDVTLSWIISKGQIASVVLMLLVTACLMLSWYIGMKNIYTKYFRTHRLEALGGLSSGPQKDKTL